VTASCSSEPAHHSAASGADVPNSDTPAVASSSTDTGTAPRKACRAGCASSAATASACTCQRIQDSTASATKASAATPASTSATPVAVSPSIGMACSQASDSPATPITMANQLKDRCWRFSGWLDMARR
jgi:hypothetical protein